MPNLDRGSGRKRLVNQPMNTRIIRAAPSGGFEEISIEMPFAQWRDTFLGWVRQRKPVKYELHNMPVLSKAMEHELAEQRYVHFILENTDWHFLVPMPHNSD